MIRVVIDSGVFISALIGRRGSAPDLVMRAFVDDRFQVVASPLILAELELVLRRPKLAAYVDERVAREFVERVRRHATIVDDPVERPAVTRDRKDDYLVALARGERVDAIVSGDRDITDAGLADPAVRTPRESADRPRRAESRGTAGDPPRGPMRSSGLSGSTLAAHR